MKTKIKAIYIKTEKGKEPVCADSAVLLENEGVSGDVFCSTDAKRQVSVLFDGTLESMKLLKKRGVCASRFTCNIVLDGEFPEEISVGGTIKVGKTELKVTEIGKKCFGFCGEETCPLVNEAVFASVTHGGTVKKGDDAEYA